MTPRSRIRPALAALLLAAVAGGAHAQSERRSVAGNSVAIYDIAGAVRVEAGSGNDVVVEVTRGGRDAAKLDVEVGDLRGRNTFRVIFPSTDIVYPALGRWSNSEFSTDRDGTWGGDRKWYNGRRVRVRGSGSGLEAWADLRILVPAGKSVEVDLGVGKLEASNVKGDLHFAVASAHVDTRMTVGNLTIEAGSGGASVSDASGGDLSVETGSGGVQVDGVSSRTCKLSTGSGGVTGGRVGCEELSLEAGSGSVRVSGVKAQRIKAETGSGGVTLGLDAAPRDLKVEAGSGGVTVSLPASTGADVEISTGSGGIESDFALTVDKFERHHVRGRIGDGAGRIRIDSGSGSVRLRKN